MSTLHFEALTKEGLAYAIQERTSDHESLYHRPPWIAKGLY